MTKLQENVLHTTTRTYCITFLGTTGTGINRKFGIVLGTHITTSRTMVRPYRMGTVPAFKHTAVGASCFV